MVHTCHVVEICVRSFLCTVLARGSAGTAHRCFLAYKCTAHYPLGGCGLWEVSRDVARSEMWRVESPKIGTFPGRSLSTACTRVGIIEIRLYASSSSHHPRTRHIHMYRQSGIARVKCDTVSDGIGIDQFTWEDVSFREENEKIRRPAEPALGGSAFAQPQCL